MTDVGKFKPNSATKLSTMISLSFLFVLYHLLVHALSITAIFQSFDLALCLSLVLAATFFVQHELLHLLVATLCGYRKRSELNLFSVDISGFMEKRDLLMILLAPVVIMTPTYIALAIAYNRFALLFLLVAAVNYVGSKNDRSTVMHALKYRGPVYFADNTDTGEIHAYQADHDHQGARPEARAAYDDDATNQ